MSPRLWLWVKRFGQHQLQNQWLSTVGLWGRGCSARSVEMGADQLNLGCVATASICVDGIFREQAGLPQRAGRERTAVTADLGTPQNCGHGSLGNRKKETDILGLDLCSR